MATVPTVLTVTVGMKNSVANYLTYVRDVVSFLINPPRVKVYQTTTATTAGTSGVGALVSWDAEEFDTDVMHDLVSNPSRMIAKTAGTYDVKVSIAFVANATGWRQVEIRKNSAGAVGSGTQIAQFRVPATATLSGDSFGSVEVALAANDYLECFVTQTSGGSLATTVGQSFTWASMRWVAVSMKRAMWNRELELLHSRPRYTDGTQSS